MRTRRIRPFALALLVLLVVPGIASAAPVIAVDSTVVDVGTVGQGDVIEHVFTVRNDGDRPLNLREVRASCGCTVTEYDEQIAPGASGQITMTVDTAGFLGATAKPITVYSDDVRNPALRLTIKADVRPYVAVIPGWIRFQRVVGQPATSATQTLWANSGDPLVVRSAESSVDSVSVSVAPATPDERDDQGPDTQWTLTATLAADAPAGPVVGNIVVTTNNADRPTIEIPLAGFVKPVVSIAPRAVSFGRFAASEGRRSSLIVTNNGEAAVGLVSVDTGLPGLAAEIQEREAGRQYQILLTLESGLEPGAFESTLRIETDREDIGAIEIPVKGTAL